MTSARYSHTSTLLNDGRVLVAGGLGPGFVAIALSTAELFTPDGLAPSGPQATCDDADGIWHNTNMSLSCTAIDNGTGLANPNDASFSLTTSVPADTETSNASSNSRVVCNTAEVCTTVGPINNNKIDRKAPDTVCAEANGLWQAGDVALACTGSDAGSGLNNPADGSFSLSTNVPAGSESKNAFTGSHSVCDAVNNCVTAGPIGANKIEITTRYVWFSVNSVESFVELSSSRLALLEAQVSLAILADTDLGHGAREAKALAC